MRTSRWSLVVFVTLTMLMANWNAYSESCDPGCAGVYESCAATKAAGLGSCCQDQNVYYGTCVDNELEGIVTVDHGLIVPEHSEDCYEFVNPGICDTFPVLCWLYCLARLNPGTDSNASFQTLSPPAICLYVRSDCTDCWGGYAGGLNDCAVQYQQCCGGAGGGGGAGVPSGVQLLPPAGPGDPAAVTRGGKALACVGEPVDLATGNMYLTHTDYTASGLSRELSLVRTYNSQNQNSGIFGVGWSTPFDEELTVIDPLHLSISRGNGSVVYFGRYNESETIYVPYMPPDDKSQVIVDESGTDTEYVLMLKSGEKRVFDSAGRFIGISDRNDNVTTLTYDQSGRLTTVTSPTGRELSFVYNAAGKVSSVADGVNGSIGPEYDPSILGTVASYEYDPASGLLSEVTYPDGFRYQYVYTYNSGTSGYYLSSVRDALNNILEAHEYDTEGRAITSEIGDGVDNYTITYVSDTETKVVDALGRETRTVFDASRGIKVPISITGPYCEQAPASRYRSYDYHLNLTSETDQLGHRTYYSYDVDGNVTAVWSAIERELLSYNEYGQVVMHRDALGGVTNEYDERGNLLTSTDADGATTTFTYSPNGLVLTKTDPRNNTTRYEYDDLGNLKLIRDATNKVIARFQHDVRGRVRKYTDAMGNETLFSYDARNRLVLTSYPDGSTEQRTYNLAGQLVQVVDGNGNATTYEYDSAGRLIRIVDAQGRQINRTYDLMSNMTSETDTAGRTTNFVYNDMNKVTKIIYPAASPGAGRLETSYVYDAVGNLIESRDTANRVTEYTPDAGGRIVSVKDPANFLTTMGYDVHDNVTGVVDPSGQEYEFVYDYHDGLKMIKRDGGVRVREYVYDPAGNMTEMRDYDGSVTYYDYDQLNRVWRIRFPDNATSTFTYDDASRLISATNENGTVTFSYDEMGRVSSVTDVWGRTIEYTYDGNGNRTSMTLGSVRFDYEYDSLNRLVNMYDTSNNSATFAYDSADRLVTRTLNGVFVAEYSYNNLDLITNIRYKKGSATLANFQYGYSNDLNISQITDRNGTYNYAYDLRGQLTSAALNTSQVESFTYDAIGNHLNPDGTMPPPQHVSYLYDANGNLKVRTDRSNVAPVEQNVTYKYDALGRRVARIKGSEWTRYTYDGEDVVLDENSDGSLVYYGNGPGIDNKLWYVEGSSDPVFFLTDHLGSTRALVSSTGSIIAGSEVDYDSFGIPSTTQVPTRFLYAGREYDPDTELYYYRARWYDPQAKRFISEDPIGLAGGINLYAYVSNNPINSIDPLGLVEAPGTLESLIPVWGSGKQAIHDFETGHYVWGTINSVVAVSDVFLVKAVATGVVKGAIKCGSHSWRATRAWMAKTGRAEAGQEVHHWLIPQGRWGESVPNAIKNQPWNLMPMESPELHRAIHGYGELSKFGQFMQGTPDWFKALLGSSSGRVLDGQR